MEDVGLAVVDFNNDGRKDLFVCGGDVMDAQGEFKERVPQTNLVMANLGDLKFQDATPDAGPDFSLSLEAQMVVHREGDPVTPQPAEHRAQAALNARF